MAPDLGAVLRAREKALQYISGITLVRVKLVSGFDPWFAHGCLIYLFGWNSTAAIRYSAATASDILTSWNLASAPLILPSCSSNLGWYKSFSINLNITQEDAITWFLFITALYVSEGFENSMSVC